MFISQIIGASTTHMNHSLHIIHRPNSEVGSLGSAYFASLGMPRVFCYWSAECSTSRRALGRPRKGPTAAQRSSLFCGLHCNLWKDLLQPVALILFAREFARLSSPFSNPSALWFAFHSHSNHLEPILVEFNTISLCELTTLVLNKLAFKKAWFSCLLALPHVALNNPLFFANSSYVRFRFVLKYNPF